MLVHILHGLHNEETTWKIWVFKKKKKYALYATEHKNEWGLIWVLVSNYSFIWVTPAGKANNKLTNLQAGSRILIAVNSVTTGVAKNKVYSNLHNVPLMYKFRSVILKKWDNIGQLDKVACGTKMASCSIFQYMFTAGKVNILKLLQTQKDARKNTSGHPNLSFYIVS